MPKMFHKHKTPGGMVVYKPTPDRSKYWRTRKHSNGVTASYNLGTNLAKAKKLADKIQEYLVFHTHEEAKEHFYTNQKQVKKLPTIPSFAQTLAAFRKSAEAKGLAERTVTDYENTLWQVIRLYAPKGRTKREDRMFVQRARLKPIICLNPQAWHVMVQDAFNTRGNKPETKRTLNKILATLQALVGPRHMIYMENWNPEWVADFMKIKPFPRVGAKYKLPDSDLILDTIARIDIMEPSPEKTMLMLALRGGMRRGEIINMKMDWIEKKGDVYQINIEETEDYKPKGTSGFTQIPASFVEQLGLPQSGYVLGTEDAYLRKLVVPTNAVSLLREWGWDNYSNPLHELRKLFGSMIASSHGLFQAQAFLRHSSSQLTYDKYAGLVLEENVLQVWACGVGKNRKSRPRSSVVQQSLPNGLSQEEKELLLARAGVE